MAVTAAETLLASDRPLVNEAWYRMQGCYKKASKLPPPPNRITLAYITAEQVELYRRVPPSGDRIPIETSPFAIDYSIPLVDDIEWEVCCL